MTSRTTAVVIVAAGKGERLGATVPKAFVEIAGRTILSIALRQALAQVSLGQIIIAAPASHVEHAREVLAAGLVEARDVGGAAEARDVSEVRVAVVAGGVTRQESIGLALAELGPEIEVVLVHDAARCFAPTALFNRVDAAVRETGKGIVPGLPVVDSVKRVLGAQVLQNVDRSELILSQTPQGFVAADLRAAYAAATADYSDDAALVQAAGYAVLHVPGETAAFKVTTPADLDRAHELALGAGASHGMRVGIGTDTHRFSADPERPLLLGGIVWPGERGLDGHSDGDALCHALVDALLSAIGAGDIGSNFGVDRPEFAGAGGEVFLVGALGLVRAAGFRVVNASLQLIGDRPRVAARRVEVERYLSGVLAAPVSLSGTTTDGLGFLGNSEGVAAVASVLLERESDR